MKKIIENIRRLFMNKNLQEIFDHYTEKFSFFNNQEYNENYKWAIAKMF